VNRPASILGFNNDAGNQDFPANLIWSRRLECGMEKRSATVANITIPDRPDGRVCPDTPTHRFRGETDLVQARENQMESAPHSSVEASPADRRAKRAPSAVVC
jgi:hypothetical protein